MPGLGFPSRAFCFMKTTSKKGAKKSKAKPRASSAATSIAKLKKTIAAQAREIREGAEQQAATSDILGVISGAPTDLQPVFDTIAEHSVKLCGALFSSVYRFDGELIHMVADHN